MQFFCFVSLCCLFRESVKNFSLEKYLFFLFIKKWFILVPRDINERGRDLDYVLNQYMNFVKPAFEEFCLPTKKFADVIIPRGADNTGKFFLNTNTHTHIYIYTILT